MPVTTEHQTARGKSRQKLQEEIGESTIVFADFHTRCHDWADLAGRSHKLQTCQPHNCISQFL